MQYWIYVCHTSQLPQPGSFFTAKIGREPIILVRDETGQVEALSNVCRHRGSLVCNEAQGQVKKLVCPYHQWVYDLDGTLRAAKLMPDDFDKTGFNSRYYQPGPYSDYAEGGPGQFVDWYLSNFKR